MLRCLWSGGLMLLLLIEGGFASEAAWAMRNSAEGAKKAYEIEKAAFAASPSYENACALARICRYYGTYFVADREGRLALFSEGTNAASLALHTDTNRPDAYFYYAANLGSIVEIRQGLEGLSALPEVMRTVCLSISIAPSWNCGEALVMRGRLYHKSPAVISFGSAAKAEADYLAAIRLCPSNRLALRYYAELLWEGGRKGEAKALVEKALALPLNRADTYVENLEIATLTALKEKGP